MLRFAFFGTPIFSVRVLDALERHGYSPALVVTAPDKPRGRGLRLSPPPAKSWALERGIDVLQPETLNPSARASGESQPNLSGRDLIAELANTDWDVFIVAAYAKLLPQALLHIPRRGCLNVHPSLLPKFRGPSPVVSAILADEPAPADASGHPGGRQTGVTIMQMSAAMDAGPIVAAARIEIDEADWPPPASVLTELLFTEGGNLLAEVLPSFIRGATEATPQDDAAASFTKKFAGSDAALNPSGFDGQNVAFENPREAFLKIRAFDHGPRAHFFAEKDGKKIRVIVSGASWRDGRLTIERVIPEGKKEISYREFAQSGARPVSP